MKTTIPTQIIQLHKFSGKTKILKAAKIKQIHYRRGTKIKDLWSETMQSKKQWDRFFFC